MQYIVLARFASFLMLHDNYTFFLKTRAISRALTTRNIITLNIDPPQNGFLTYLIICTFFYLKTLGDQQKKQENDVNMEVQEVVLAASSLLYIVLRKWLFQEAALGQSLDTSTIPLPSTSSLRENKTKHSNIWHIWQVQHISSTYIQQIQHIKHNWHIVSLSKTNHSNFLSSKQ